jgi:hypothetical protein
MSSVLTMPPTLPYRCPDCRSIDWYRDGCVIVEDAAAVGLTCGRVQRLDECLVIVKYRLMIQSHELAAELEDRHIPADFAQPARISAAASAKT